ncbi:HU family DNA-binding protein [Nitratifractor salsuginis]|uniref:Histone family protein DNA-binding protein n=1 Tax=Nitratifractor salsuginis (strain DSM 16511 / JCM 12458 / E9I37-1) TaxID=749222 RepID=E6X0L3_NITSE|nr:HU family DNA-binding protein [Nitratifractor salsuginis]ADV45733.1 histone family protein DNA-binding protein [Nitratifractor salsuginis DSM 16511]
MTKAEFVELVQEKGGYESKAAAEKAIKAFTEAIEEALKRKETVTLVGFGTFSTVEVPEKSGKVPGTDKTYTKPAHTAPKFKFGKSIKDAVAK